MDPSSKEQSLVHDVYNEIAPHFSQTRYKPWPIVERFLKSRPAHAVGLDVGCGNGKYLNVNPDLFIIGSDRSTGLIDCAYGLNSNYNLAVADGLSLPHPLDTFDFAISIAVIHHFSTEDRRIEAIKEIMSRVKVGGQALIYCWALEQENSRRGYKEGDDQDVLVPWVLQEKKEKKQKKEKKSRRGRKDKAAESADAVEQQEAEQEPEQTPEPEPEQAPAPEPVTKYRYYHLYKKGELASNAQAAGNCIIAEEGYEKDNWWIVLQRV